MKNKNQKAQQSPKNNFKQIVAPHLIALGILAGMVALNYAALSNIHGGLDNVGIALGYIIIIRFFELLIFIDIVWLILRLLSVKSTGKAQKKLRDQKTSKTSKKDAGDFLRIVLYVIILCVSLYLCYSSMAGFLQAWNAYHSLNDLVALVNLLAAVLFGGLVGITCYNIIKFTKSKQ